MAPTAQRTTGKFLIHTTLIILGIVLCTEVWAAAEDNFFEHLRINKTLLISLLLILCSWLAYRLFHSRLEILNIQAIDFHALADNAHDGIFIVQNGNIVYANQRAAEILSYKHDELTQLTLLDIIYPDEADKVFAIHQKRIKGEDVPKQYEATFLNKSNNKVPVELTAAVTSWQGKIAALVIIRDITERKLIDKTLIDSEKRYRSLVENSPDAILVIDVASNSIIEANNQSELLFDLHRQLLYATPADKLGQIDNDRQKPFTDYLERALHGLPLIFERRFKTNSGDIFYCEVRLSRMPFPGQKLVRASIIDITQRKQIQDALNKSEQRLATFFEASCEVLFFHEKGIIIDANDAVVKMFGYKKNEIINRHVIEFLAPESQTIATNQIAKDAEDPYELVAIHKNGNQFPIQVQAKTIKQDGKSIRVVSITDISSLKQASDKLLSSESDMQNIIDNMLDIYYRTDKSGNITMISPSSERLLGYPPGELVGRDISTLCADPYDRQFFLDTLSKQNSEVRDYELALRHQNGDILWVSTNARYRYDRQGNLDGVEGILRDITSQRSNNSSTSQAKMEEV